MDKRILCCFLFISFVCDVRSYNEAFQVLDLEADSCALTCQQNRSSDIKSCVRGCRLFVICDWAADTLKEALDNCKLACEEAYGNTSGSNAACWSGCDAAFLPAKKRQAKLAKQELALRTSFFSPFSSLFDSDKPVEDMFTANDESWFSIDKLMNRMLASAIQSFVFSGPASYSRHRELIQISDGDSEQMIIIEYAKPEIYTAQPTERKMVLNTGSEGSKTTLKDRFESNLQTNVNRKSTFEFLDNPDYWEKPQYHSQWDQMKSKTKRWWNCMTKKAHLPELVFFIFWASVAFLLALLCCSQCYPRSNKLSVNGDLAFVSDCKGSLPSYIEPYPSPKSAKKSPYYLASVVSVADEKALLPE